MSYEKKVAEERHRHLREIIKLKGKAIALALKLQARIYEQRLDALEKKEEATAKKVDHLWWTAAGVSLAVSTIVTGIGLWVALHGR